MERLNTAGKALAAGEDGAASIAKGCAEIRMEKFDQLPSGFNVSVLKLWDLFKLKLTEAIKYGDKCDFGGFQVSVSLDEYMLFMGMPSTKTAREKARKTVEEDLESLFSIRLDWLENGGKRGRFSTRLCVAKGITNSRILFSFAPQMASYLTNAYVMQFPMKSLGLTNAILPLTTWGKSFPCITASGTTWKAERMIS